MLLQLKEDLNSIYPQSQWDKIDTIVPLFIQTERTHLRKYLGTELLNKLNEDYLEYEDTGIQSAIVAFVPASADADDEVVAQSKKDIAMLDIISACQRYIAYLTFANNVRIFSSSFNRGGGVNRAFSDNYETLDEKDYAALSKELFMQSQDALEDLLILLEQDAKSTKIYTDYWKKNDRYFYHHSSLLFPTALALNPYYDINERREKFQSLAPTIESCQRRYILPNIGIKLYDNFLRITNAVFGSQQTTNITDNVNKVLTSALPDLLHALAYYIRADLTTAPKTQQEQQQYLLRAEQHRNLALRTVCDEYETMKDYICGTPLDKVFADLNNGVTLTVKLVADTLTGRTTSSSSQCRCRRTLPSDSFILDLT